MSSKHKKRARYYPTSWSEWQWNEQYQCKIRYREVSEGNWEWDYSEPETERETPYTPSFSSNLTSVYGSDPEWATALSDHYRHDDGLADITQGLAGTTIDSRHSQDALYAECQQYTEGGHKQEYFESSETDPGNSKGSETKCPECSMTFLQSTELERHHKTVHLNNGVRPYKCLVPGCPAKVRSWTTMRGLRLHERNWHGPHSCSVPGCSRHYPFGFSSEADLEVHQVEHSGDLKPDKGRDERYDRKGKGSSYKGGDTSYDNQNYASEEYSEAEVKQQPLQDSSPLEGNARPGPLYGSNYYSSTNPVYHEQPSYASYSTVPFPANSSMMRNIRTENLVGNFDRVDKRFKVHRSTDFQFGRVFKVLWSEPLGSGGTEITAEGRYSERNFQKVRRFLIVSERNKGHSICIPILTYGNQGVLKRGVHPGDHAVVYSSKRQGPYVLEREKGLMSKHPIRVEVINDAQKLDPLSRLNYGKLYTVEHNVKVSFIGKVARNYEMDLRHGYNEAHPPFQAGPSYHQGSFEDLTSFAEQDDPLASFTASSTATAYESSVQYPAAYPAYDDGYNAD